MTIYTGYVTITHDTYANWKGYTFGNGYDFDQQYGLQCYDLVVEFWWNVGFPQGYPTSAGTGNACDIWTDRANNVSYNGVTYFDLVYSLDEVIRGDIVVYNGYSGNPYGHIGFADEDYSTWHANNPSSYEFPILSQNNGGIPYPSGGSTVNVHGYDTRLFLGAFRYKEWHTTPPTPPVVSSYKSHFKWALYARKLRDKRKGL